MSTNKIGWKHIGYIGKGNTSLRLVLCIQKTFLLSKFAHVIMDHQLSRTLCKMDNP